MKQTQETKQYPTILGAIIGDVIGSAYEFDNYKGTDVNLFPEDAIFTDDTVLTMAIADSLYNNQLDFAQSLYDYGRNYYRRRYGRYFFNWLLKEDKQPYNSFGNGSAMRVSPIGFFYHTLDDVLKQAKKSAECTHNHPEGIKGAQAVASAIFLARKGKSKEEIKEYITNTFGYNLDFKLDDIREDFEFDMSCAYTIPPAIVAFLESDDYESAIRLAISIGGDSDTIACITGGIASAYYKEIPQEMIDFVKAKLPNKFLELIEKFDNNVFVDDIMSKSEFYGEAFKLNMF